MKTKRLLSLCVLGIVLTTFVATVSAAEFYAIVDSFGKKPRNAYLDVSVDTSVASGPVDVSFNVYNELGGQVGLFSLTTNGNGFVSTASFANLFNLTGGQPMLVRARTPDSAVTSAATLHIDSLGAPMIIGLTPVRRRSDGTSLSQGTQFAIALGNFRSASLLVGNVSGSDIEVDVFKGSQGANGFGIFSNPHLAPNAIWKVNLTQNEALSNLIVHASGPVIMQAVIDDGQTIQSFMVLPAQ